MCVCTNIYIHVSLSIHIYIYIYIYVCVCVRISVNVWASFTLVRSISCEPWALGSPDVALQMTWHNSWP